MSKCRIQWPVEWLGQKSHTYIGFRNNRHLASTGEHSKCMQILQLCVSWWFCWRKYLKTWVERATRKVKVARSWTTGRTTLSSTSTFLRWTYSQDLTAASKPSLKSHWNSKVIQVPIYSTRHLQVKNEGQLLSFTLMLLLTLYNWTIFSKTPFSKFHGRQHQQMFPWEVKKPWSNITVKNTT